MAQRGADKAGTGAHDAAYAATGEEVYEFLKSEAERDPDIVARFRAARRRAEVDHRPRVRKIFDDAVQDNIHAESFGHMEVDLSPLLDEAGSLEHLGHHAGAGKIYRHIGEVIAEYMPGFDRWEGEYREILAQCVDGAARCAGAGGDPAAWSEWIAYAVGMFLDTAGYRRYGGSERASHLDPVYRGVLERRCRKKSDLEHWLSELKRQSSGEGGRSRAAPRSSPVLLMKAYVAGRLGGAAGRDRQLESEYKGSAKVCAAYARRLRRGSPRKAGRVAAYGARKFPYSREVQLLALSLCPKSSAEYRIALRRMFVMTGAQRHLDELRKRSPRWNADRRAVIEDLKDSPELLARVLDAEGMTGALAKAVFASGRSDLLKRHHARLAVPRHGARLFDEHKKNVENIMARARHSGHYAEAAAHLRRMRSIPGQEARFRRYVGQLRKRYARRHALMSRLDKL